MEPLLKEQVKNEVQALVQTIKQDELYQTYLQLSEKMRQNDAIMELIDAIKKMQRQIVRGNLSKEEITVLEEAIKEKEKRLESYPLYLDFIEVQKELDGLFQLVRNTITTYFDEKTS